MTLRSSLDRECRWCGGSLAAEPYEYWLFYTCRFCSDASRYWFDAYNAPGVPPRW